MLSKDDSLKLDEISQLPAFTNLTSSQKEQLASAMVRKTYEPGELIFFEGDDSGGLWFVIDGRVKIIKQSLSGRIQGLCLMDRGKCFGSCPLFDMDKYPATAQALDKVTLLILIKDDLQHYTEHNPQLVSILLNIYSQRLEQLARVSEVLGMWTVNDRINDCLRTYARPQGQRVVVELTHDKLAELAGTVREVVTRHLSRLEQMDIIQNEPGKITIINSGALALPCGC